MKIFCCSKVVICSVTAASTKSYPFERKRIRATDSVLLQQKFCVGGVGLNQLNFAIPPGPSRRNYWTKIATDI